MFPDKLGQRDHGLARMFDASTFDPIKGALSGVADKMQPHDLSKVGHTLTAVPGGDDAVSNKETVCR